MLFSIAMSSGRRKFPTKYTPVRCPGFRVAVTTTAHTARTLSLRTRDSQILLLEQNSIEQNWTGRAAERSTFARILIPFIVLCTVVEFWNIIFVPLFPTRAGASRYRWVPIGKMRTPSNSSESESKKTKTNFFDKKSRKFSDDFSGSAVRAPRARGIARNRTNIALIVPPPPCTQSRCTAP